MVWILSGQNGLALSCLQQGISFLGSPQAKQKSVSALSCLKVLVGCPGAPRVASHH